MLIFTNSNLYSNVGGIDNYVAVYVNAKHKIESRLQVESEVPRWLNGLGYRYLLYY